MEQVASGGARLVNVQTPASWPTFLPFASSSESAKIRSSPRLGPFLPRSSCTSWYATANLIVCDSLTLAFERDAAAAVGKTMVSAAASAISSDFVLMVASLGVGPPARSTAQPGSAGISLRWAGGRHI